MADADGVVSITVVIPLQVRSGSHTLVLTGGGVVRQSVVTIRGPLPRTGTGTHRLAVSGLGFVLAGVLLAAAARGRRLST